MPLFLTCYWVHQGWGQRIVNWQFCASFWPNGQHHPGRSLIKGKLCEFKKWWGKDHRWVEWPKLAPAWGISNIILPKLNKSSNLSPPFLQQFDGILQCLANVCCASQMPNLKWSGKWNQISNSNLFGLLLKNGYSTLLCHIISYNKLLHFDKIAFWIKSNK